MKLSKKVTLHRVPKVNNFITKNSKVLMDGKQKIGSSINAVNAILVKDDELRSYMPKIVGVSVNSPNWEKELADYFNSITYEVRENGSELEIGFDYNPNLPASKELIARNKDILTLKGVTNELAFAEYCRDKISDDERYQYGLPINIADYVLYRYCENYKPVANDIESIGNSKDIRFYIVDQDLVRRREAENLSIRTKAKAIFIEIVSDSQKSLAIIYALGRQYELTDKSDYSIQKLIETISNDMPNELIAAYNDKTVDTKAFIERLIDVDILTRVPNTQIVKKTADGVTLGSTIDEVVAFFENQANAKIVNDWEMQLKAIPSK